MLQARWLSERSPAGQFITIHGAFSVDFLTYQRHSLKPGVIGLILGSIKISQVYQNLAEVLKQMQRKLFEILHLLTDYYAGL